MHLCKMGFLIVNTQPMSQESPGVQFGRSKQPWISTNYNFADQLVGIENQICIQNIRT